LPNHALTLAPKSASNLFGRELLLPRYLGLAQIATGFLGETMSRLLLSIAAALLSAEMVSAQQLSPNPQQSNAGQTAAQPAGATNSTSTAPAATKSGNTTPSSATSAPVAGNALTSNPVPQPVTKTLSGAGLADPNDIAGLLAPDPLKPSKLSLIGGTVKSIDQIRDHMTVRIFGAGTMKVKFDQRTHFYRDGKEITQIGVKRGDRVYLDTQLNEGSVFARNVHVHTRNEPADASGQIVSYDSGSGEMVVRDELANSAVRFRVLPNTAIRKKDAAGNRADLRPGALIAVKFSPQSRNEAAADEVQIIAEPGTSFTYFGRVSHLDLRSGVLDIDNQSDGKNYEVHFDSTRVPQNLTVGSQVTVVATFTGHNYTAQNIEVNAAAQAEK
jgi:hypothetical protein